MKRVCLILYFIFSVSFSNAQHNHDHSGEENEIKKNEPPHGGSIVESGKRNIEIVYEVFGGEEKLNVWLLSQKNKVKSIKNASAKLTLRYSNGSVVTNDMIMKDDKFYSNIKDLENPFNAIIVITLKTKHYTATFTYKGINKQ